MAFYLEKTLLQIFKFDFLKKKICIALSTKHELIYGIWHDMKIP